MTAHPPARDEAIAHMGAVRDFWYPLPVPPGLELDAVPTDTLQRYIDERRMAAMTCPGRWRGWAVGSGMPCGLPPGHRGAHGPAVKS